MTDGFNEQLLAQLRAGEQAISRVDYLEAEKILKGAIEFVQVFPENKDAAAGVVECLARVCTAAGRLPDARQHYEKLVALRVEVAGKNHPDTARARIQLAHALEKLQDLELAADQLRQAFAALRAQLGPQHPETQNCLKRSISIQDAIRRKNAVNSSDVNWVG